MKFDIPANSNDLLKNAALPFLLEESNIRGHFVRLNEEANNVLSKHKYPVRVSQLLGELLILVSMVGTMLKLKGMISIQAQSDGAVGFISADYTNKGHIRGYAHINDQERMRKIEAKGRKEQDITEIFGKGNIVITIENKNEQPYQAILPLEGKSLTECVMEYLRQSNQLDAVIEVAANKIGRKWHAGGVVLQRVPKKMDENWSYATTMLTSVTDRELIDDNLPMATLLYRLFHEGGVRVFEPKIIEARCRCSRERMINALKMLSPEERQAMKVKGMITMTCHFCNNEEKFKDSDIL